MLQQFIATIGSYGIAKGNRYTVYLDVPRSMFGIQDVNPYMLQTIALFCNRADLPAVSVSTANYRTTGEQRNYAFDRNFDSFSLSFYCDASMSAKYFFEQWIFSIQDTDGRSFQYFDDYTVPKFTVDMENQLDIPQYRTEFYNVYPKEVSALQLSYENNGLMEITVVFEYQYSKTYKLVNGVVPGANYLGVATDAFINIQGVIGLPGSTGKYASGTYATGVVVNAGTSILGGVVGGLQNNFTTLGVNIGGLAGQIPSQYLLPSHTVAISAMGAQSNGYATQSGNVGIQLGSPAGLNIPSASMAGIAGQIASLNGSITNGAINASIAGFASGATSSAAVTANLSTIQGQLNTAGVGLGSLSSSVTAGIQLAENGFPGVSVNGPR